MASPEVIDEHPRIEDVLASHADPARGDAGYRGYHLHVYRVLNLSRVLARAAHAGTAH